MRLRCPTSAAKARLGIAIAIINMRTIAADAPCAANGPRPNTVPQAAKPRRMSDAVAVSRGPRRNAAQIGGRTARTASGAVGKPAANGLKASAPTAPAAAKTVVDSTNGAGIERARALRRPQDQGRGDHQQPGQIALPPGGPDGGELFPFDLSDADRNAEAELDAGADAGVDGRGNERDQRERGDAARQREGMAAPSPLIDQDAARERCQGVPRRDGSDGVAWPRRDGVGHKGGRKDRRHDPVSAKQDGRQRKSSRQRNGRRARVGRGEFKVYTREKKIGRADRRELKGIFQGARQDRPSVRGRSSTRFRVCVWGASLSCNSRNRQLQAAAVRAQPPRSGTSVPATDPRSPRYLISQR